MFPWDEPAGRTDSVGPFRPMPASVAVLSMLPDSAIPGWLQAREAVDGAIGALHFDGRPHVTVAYLGPTGKDHIDEVLRSAEATARATPAAEVTTGRLVAFPPNGGKTPVVLLLPNAGALPALNDRLESELFAGSNRTRYPYVPHLTLGYLASTKTPQIQQALDLIKPGVIKWIASGLTVTVSGREVATTAFGGK